MIIDGGTTFFVIIKTVSLLCSACGGLIDFVIQHINHPPCRAFSFQENGTPGTKG